jgi:SecDF, P1 head subdomain
VNEPAPLIKDALREIAAEAPVPGRLADAAWQAGRRRRRRGLAAAVTAGAGAIAAVIALIVTVTGSPVHTGKPAGPAAVVRLQKPIEFQQIAAIHHGPHCPAGPGWLPGSNACFRVTGPRMRVTELRSARIVQSPPGTYVLVFRLAGTDVRRFAALTSMLARQPSPRNQLAIILSGIVFSHPTVRVPITTGQAVLNGGYTRPGGPEGILHHLGYLPPGSGG